MLATMQISMYVNLTYVVWQNVAVLDIVQMYHTKILLLVFKSKYIQYAQRQSYLFLYVDRL